MCESVTNVESLKFTFEGDYEVDALSVAKAIESLVELSSLTANYNYPDVQFRLAIKAITPGSLNLVFLAVSQAAQTFLTPTGIQYAKTLMETIKIFFDLKKFFKGQQPKKTIQIKDRIEVENADGCKLSIPTAAGVYFIDQRIDNSISNIFNSALGSPNVTGITLTQNNGGTVHVEASEFQTCAVPIKIEDAVLTKEIESERTNEILYVRQPDLLGERQWGLKSDKYIYADIADVTFLNAVKSGSQPIVAKMYIVADMKVTMQLGNDGLPDENKCHYVITKVHSVHIPEEGQASFFN